MSDDNYTSGSSQGGLMDALASAVEGKLCQVSACTANPVSERNGRVLCAKHRDHYDYSTMGKPCERCGSRQWVATPDSVSVAVCALCDFVTYDESVIEHSWEADTDSSHD